MLNGITTTSSTAIAETANSSTVADVRIDNVVLILPPALNKIPPYLYDYMTYHNVLLYQVVNREVKLNDI